MASPQLQLRLIQTACIVLLGGCVATVYVGTRHNPQTPTHFDFEQGTIILLALWSGIGGFTMQRKLHRRQATFSKSKSTPFTRWRVGHIIRLWSSLAVGMWGLLLYEFRGPLWIACALFGLAMLLLLTWTPGTVPANDGVVA